VKVLVRVLVMRYDKGKLPPASLTEEVKATVGAKVGKFLEANPEVKFNGLFVNKEGIGICDWEAPNAKTVEDAVEAVGIPHDEVIVVERAM